MSTNDSPKSSAAKHKTDPAATEAHKGSAGVERSDRKTEDSPDFGVEGTNKTLHDPGPDATPTGEMTGTPTKYVPDSPYKRRTT